MKDDIYWVGAIDWSVRQFHGYFTEDGTSYNSYLIMDEQPTLIDTVRETFAIEFLERLSLVCPLDKLQNIVIQHAEPDHASALPHLLKKAPNATVYCSKKCVEFLEAFQFVTKETKVVVVDAKYELNIGKRTLNFKPTPLLHWPESMCTYIKSDKVLFSQDLFGQHLAATERFQSPQIQEKVLIRAKEYLCNIMGHLQIQLKTAIDLVQSNDFEYILPAHGLSFNNKSDIEQVLKLYRDYNLNKHLLKKIVILYDSMYGATTQMTQVLAEAIKQQGFTVVPLDLKVNTFTRACLHCFDACGIAVGSPTLNHTMMPKVEACLSYLKGLQIFANKPTLVFGSYGWSSNAIKDITFYLQGCKANVIGQFQHIMSLSEGKIDEVVESGNKLAQASLEYLNK